MVNKGLIANAQTFCSIALACRRQKDAMQLLTEMEVWNPISSFYYSFSLLIYLRFPLITIISNFLLNIFKCYFFFQSCGLVPNTHVYSALISQAVKRLDYAYLHELLQHMHKLQVPPNDVIIRQLEFATQYPPSYDKVRNWNWKHENLISSKM